MREMIVGLSNLPCTRSCGLPRCLCVYLDDRHTHNPTATVQLVPGLFNVTGGSYNFDSGLLTLALAGTINSGETQTMPISFQLPNNNQPATNPPTNLPLPRLLTPEPASSLIPLG